MQSWKCEVDHLKDYLCLESYLLNFPSHDQLLGLLVNIALKICPLISPAISLCDDECTGYHMNQVPLISLHPNQLHTFTVLASFLHFYDDLDACTIFPQLQVGVLLYLAHSELGSLIQSICKIVEKFSLFMSNWEFGILTNWSDFSYTDSWYKKVQYYQRSNSIIKS